MALRKYSLLDDLIGGLDRALRTLSPGSHRSTRPRPETEGAQEKLSESERRHAAALMRVNHAGEVCAQALYQGQGLTAKLPKIRREMENAAQEEVDHLAWCDDRLSELNASPSLLNPLWYGMSFGLGAVAGLINDKVSLGFVAATEDQVCQHLKEHLQRLPENDRASRAIVEQMLIDEKAHADMAIKAGGYKFPGTLKHAMTGVSKVMTTLSYRI